MWNRRFRPMSLGFVGRVPRPGPQTRSRRPRRPPAGDSNSPILHGKPVWGPAAGVGTRPQTPSVSNTKCHWAFRLFAPHSWIYFAGEDGCALPAPAPVFTSARTMIRSACTAPSPSALKRTDTCAFTLTLPSIFVSLSTTKTLASSARAGSLTHNRNGFRSGRSYRT